MSKQKEASTPPKPVKKKWRVEVDATALCSGHMLIDAVTEEEAMQIAKETGCEENIDDFGINSVESVDPSGAEEWD